MLLLQFTQFQFVCFFSISNDDDCSICEHIFCTVMVKGNYSRLYLRTSQIYGMNYTDAGHMSVSQYCVINLK